MSIGLTIERNRGHTAASLTVKGTESKALPTFTERKIVGINPLASSLAHFLSKSTRRDEVWERRLAKQITQAPLADIVQTVMTTEPKVIPNPAKRRHLEGNLTTTKATIRAIGILYLLLQQELGIPSRQSLKREARRIVSEDLATRPPTRLSRAGFRRLCSCEMKSLEKTNSQERSLYDGWKEDLRQKSDAVHKQYLGFKTRLGTI